MSVATSTIRETLEVFFDAGDVVELRAFKERTTASGYFDDHDKLAEEAAKLDDRAFSVYVTLNPVKHALLARAHNRIQTHPRATTSDADVLRRVWLPVDFDPVRPAGVSSAEDEKQAARERAREVWRFLRDRGFREPVIADSGNGYHLLYRLDLPNDKDSLDLVRGVLEALAFRFSDEKVSVDTTTANAARIWKLYGTTARKGDSTKDRPHRRSGLLKLPESLEPVSREVLAQLAAMRPRQPRHSTRPRAETNGHTREFDLEDWIRTHHVPVRREGSWGQGGYRWILEECPWGGHTDGAAYIVRFSNGAIAAGCHHNSCSEYGWRDLREHYEPGAYEKNGFGRPFEPFEPSLDEHPGDFETEPEPLPGGLPPVMSFDPELLPTPLRDWIMDIAERMQIPPDFCAAGSVVVAASLLGRKIGIHPKRNDDWLVVPNLWGMVVGKPAVLKSPALAEIMKPLDRLVAEAREAYEHARETYEVQSDIHKATAKALEKEIEAAARAAVRTGDRSSLEEAAARKRDNEPPAEPRPRRYKTEDPTVEKLGEILMDNPQGILVYRDELSGWLRSLEKQGREGDRSFYLEAWNGTGSYEVDRIGRGSLYIPALCVSILGSIQPGPLARYVFDATQNAAGNDGLLQRFQIVVWPDLPRDFTNIDRWPDANAKNMAYKVFRKLDELDPVAFGAEASETDSIPAIRFSSEAQEEFDRWRVGLEKRLRSGELSPPLEAHLAKYRSLMPALALIFAAIEFASDKAPGGSVGLECALRAEAWCEYLESHARRLYASAEDPALAGARALLEKIKAGEVRDGCTLREVYFGKHWAKLKNSEEVEAAARILEEYGWIRIETEKTGGRPTRRLRLHPALEKERKNS
ncbi:YfjI family protein [Rubrobacter naiadicus]|uniref:YfjI family protein n=1 Tax=Rubrobacter naiadicus TaxID=1392641 RepID=UPI00236030E6|nr:YfjI family protein [Rubrobacter naiadicus]